MVTKKGTLIAILVIFSLTATLFMILPPTGEVTSDEEYTLSPPTHEEVMLFNAKRNRYKDLGQRSADDVFNSLGPDGTGAWVSIATKPCPNENYDSCEISIKTELVHWDPTIPPNDSDTYIGKFGCKEARSFIDFEARVKKLEITFWLMIRPDVAKISERTGVGQIDDDRLFYHELLHGQLFVDEMKDPNWAGWIPLCICIPPQNPIEPGGRPWGEILIKPADPNHTIINEALEREYMNRVAADRNYFVTYFKKTFPMLNESRYFDVQFPIPWGDQKPDEYWDGWSCNTDSIEVMIVHWPDHYVRVRGRLVPVVKDGRAIVYIDPVNLGMIIDLEIFDATLWTLCDFNNDSKVGPADFALFSRTYGSTPISPLWNSLCDINRDDKVGPADFALFSRNYGKHI